VAWSWLAATIAVGMPLATSSANVGPDNAAVSARGAVWARTPHIVSPVSCSMPLVTLTTVPVNADRWRVTSRNALDGIAAMMNSAPSMARARSGSVLQAGRQIDSRQVTLIPAAALHFRHRPASCPQRVTPLPALRQYFCQRGSPGARAQDCDFMIQLRSLAGFSSRRFYSPCLASVVGCLLCVCKSPVRP